MSHTATIRALLHSNPDGIKASEIHAAIPSITRTTTIMRSLHRMPDVYIDRWVLGKGNRGQFEAVWCIVDKPANCPHPTDRKFRPKTQWVQATAQPGAMQ